MPQRVSCHKGFPGEGHGDSWRPMRRTVRSSGRDAAVEGTEAGLAPIGTETGVANFLMEKGFATADGVDTERLERMVLRFQEIEGLVDIGPFLGGFRKMRNLRQSAAVDEREKASLMADAKEDRRLGLGGE